MALLPFVGPSYNLQSHVASVQRTVNLVPVPLEPRNERTEWVFKDVPGLVAFALPPTPCPVEFIFHAPLTTDEDDIEDDPASSSVAVPSGTASYGSEGVTLALDLEVLDNIQYTWTGDKLNLQDLYPDKRVTLQIDYEAISANGSSTGDVSPFLVYDNPGTIDDVRWCTRVQGTQVHAYSDFFPGAFNIQDHGAVTGSNEYRIVFDEDGSRVHWYINNTKVRTENISRFGNDDLHMDLNFPGPSGAYSGVISGLYKDLMVYTQQGCDPIE